MADASLTRLSVAQLGGHIKAREVSPVDVAEAFIERIDATEPALNAFITPTPERARAAAGDSFHEIYLEADLETCEARDPKGLYKRARSGEIAEFTGISAPYEAPHQPDLVIDTAANDIDVCIDQLVAYVGEKFRRNGG